MGSRLGLLLLAWALTATLTPPARADRVITAGPVRVLVADPAHEAYARRVARTAEEALLRVAALFGRTPPPVVITLDPTTDVFNAVAPPLPRPKVALRLTFPLSSEVGYRARDLLELLLLHELTHTVQLSFLERPPGSSPPGPRLGLVGEAVAPVPPSWLLEGIATWVESELSAGGRRDDARSRGLLRTAALDGSWPSLADAGLITYAPWPGGQTRYLFGAAFLDHLIAEHGFDTLLAALRQYNAGGLFTTFADAWQAAAGTRLDDEWTAWSERVRTDAEAVAEAAAAARPGTLVPLTDSGWETAAAAVSADGKRLAWLSWPPALKVAELSADGLAEARVVLDGVRPERIAWLDDDTVIYNRIVRESGRSVYDLFRLELTRGRETRLTHGARARLPSVTPAGCVLYVRDDTAADRGGLHELCPDGSAASGWSSRPRWTAPPGWHLIGLAVSAGGRVALGVWREGRADLALLAGETLQLLTDDDAQDLDPAWSGEDNLLFASDRDATAFELYRLSLAERRLQKLTSSVGGAFQPTAAPAGVVARVLGGRGYDLALLPREALQDVAAKLLPEIPSASQLLLPAPAALATADAVEVRPYRPFASLLPYGWLPTGGSVSLTPPGGGLALSLLGQDDSGEHAYALTVGYDTALQGYLGGAQLELRYDYRDPGILGAFQRSYPLAAGVRVGVWPHQPHLQPRSETALGIGGRLTATVPLDRWASRVRLDAALVNLASRGDWQLDARLQGVLSRQFADPYGYRSRGPRFGVTGVWSATPTGPSLGAWGDASYYLPLRELPLAITNGLPGTLELLLRAGYRPTPPVPLALGSLAAVGTVGYRYSLPLELRWGDGRYALERLTFEPRLRLWLDGASGTANGLAGGLGTDLTVTADAVLGYGAPVGFGVGAGFTQGFWYRTELRLPL